MNRILLVVFGAAALIFATPDAAFAQGWEYAGDPLVRDSGNYMAWYKLLGLWIIFLLWVYHADWINRDSQEIGEGIGMPYTVWNPIVVFSFLPIFIIALLMPMFAITIGLVVLAYVVPLAVYTFQRNGKVQDDQKVLTGAHLKLWVQNLGKKRKVKPQKKMAYEDGPPMDFTCVAAADDAVNQSNLIAARQSPAFVTLKELVWDMLKKRAERCMLDYTQESVGVRYEVDGVWHTLDPRDRESYDMMLAVIKKMCNLNMTDRRSRQGGDVKFKIRKSKYKMTLTSQGTQTGERALLVVTSEDGKLTTLESQGMREKMLEQLQTLLKQKGMVLVSAPGPQGGLTTITVGALNATDRLLRDFCSIQDKANILPYVENLEINLYDAAAGETPDTMIAKLALKQPDAFVVPDLPNAETVRMLCHEATQQDRLIVSSVRAKEAVEALMRVLLLKAPASEFAQAVTGVVNVRLVRRLCEKCKQPYEPPPQLLQRLGIPPGRVQALYREWQPPTGDDVKKADLEPCEACNGIGYRGRIGIFEFLPVTDELRKALVNSPKLETLRPVARKAGARTIQEEGILLVAQGVTSLNELQRVLKS